MIKDAEAFADMKEQWNGVLLMREHMRKLVVGAFVFGGVMSPAAAKVVYNLPLLLAVDVLGQVLLQFRDEGRYPCNKSHVGPLMDASHTALDWENWQVLREIVRRRNKVAHDGELFDAEKRLADIELIETQLGAWGIL
jgi:hypothetical protein